LRRRARPGDPANFNATVVVAEAMRKAGFKIDIQPLDGGTLSQHRNNKGPVDHQRGNNGGWNLFIYSRPRAPTTSRASPATRSCSASAAAGGSTDQAARARLADQIQARAYQVVPYVNGGQWKQFTAVRTNVSGLGETMVPVLTLEMLRAGPC